jgi:hypothetical protein
MEKVKYRYLALSDQEKHLLQPLPEVPPDPEQLLSPETGDVTIPA